MPYVQTTDLERWLAEQARALGLDALSVEHAEPERLRAYCALVLGELAARGLLAGPEVAGCHAAPRQRAN